MIKKYTNRNRTFEFAPDNRYIKVFINGRLNGLIWNTDKVITIDGEAVVSSKFFE